MEEGLVAPSFLRRLGSLSDGVERALADARFPTELASALKRNRALAEAAAPPLCAQLEPLRQLPWLFERHRTVDAAPLLDPLVRWATAWKFPDAGPLVLPPELNARLREAGWMGRITAVDLGGRDFSWLTQATSADFWSIAGGAPRLADPETPWLQRTAPLFLNDFGPQVKLRWWLALERGDLAVARAETRHFATLLMSTDTLEGGGAALAVLRLESRAREEAVRRNLDVSDWVVPDAETLFASARAWFETTRLFAPGVTPETRARAAACVPTLCPFALEALGEAQSLPEQVSDEDRASLRSLEVRGCDQALLQQALGSALEQPSQGRSTGLVEWLEQPFWAPDAGQPSP
jgi:hypothetical protein